MLSSRLGIVVSFSRKISTLVETLEIGVFHHSLLKKLETIRTLKFSLSPLTKSMLFRRILLVSPGVLHNWELLLLTMLPMV